MKCSRRDDSRAINYTAIVNGDGKLRYAVVRFVRGIRVQRKNDVTVKQIVKWFSGTPETAVQKAIDAALDGGLIEIGKHALARKGNHRDGYYYSATRLGEDYLRGAYKL